MENFLTDHVQKLLRNKFIVVIGDSVMRAVYKDIVLLLQNNEMMQKKMLKLKGEPSHCNDALIELSALTNGKAFCEVRQYRTDYHLVRFYFVTCCHSNYVETILMDLMGEPRPDVIVMNSCLWDVSRYGPRSMQLYKENLACLFTRLRDVLPPRCLFIWSTAMPIADDPRGGVIVAEMHVRLPLLRLDVVEGNFYARQAAEKVGCDVLDLHFHFRRQLWMRAPDGVHWSAQAHRRITNLLLAHVCDAWRIARPPEAPLVAVRRAAVAHQRTQSCDPRLLGDVNGRPPAWRMPPVEVCGRLLAKMHDYRQFAAMQQQQQQQQQLLQQQQQQRQMRPLPLLWRSLPTPIPNYKAAVRYHPYGGRNM